MLAAHVQSRTPRCVTESDDHSEVNHEKKWGSNNKKIASKKKWKPRSCGHQKHAKRCDVKENDRLKRVSG